MNDFSQVILQAAPLPVFYKDSKLRYLGCNRAFEELLGISADRLLGKTADDLFPPELARVYRESDQELLRNGGTQVYESTVRMKTGEVRNVIFRKSLWTGGDGAAPGIVGVVEDVTEKKRIEERQKKEHAKYLTLFESSLDAIFVGERDSGIIFDCNRAAEMLIGRKRDEMIGCHQAILHPADEIGEGPATRTYQKHVASPDGTTLEARILRADGELRDVSILANRFEWDGRTMILGIFRDITEERKQKAEILRSREQFMLAVNGSNDGIFDWDLRDNSIFYSPKWKQILGYEDQELLNVYETFSSRLHPDDLPVVTEFCGKYLRGDVPAYRIEFRMMHKDGTYRWILARGEALRDESGRAYRMAGSHSDITERKKKEQETIRLHKQVLHASKLASIGTLAAGVAHEINNPLAIINGFVALLKESVPEDKRHMLEKQEVAVERISKVVNSLRTYARADTDIVEKLDVHQVIRETLVLMEPLFEKEGVHIETCPDAPSAVVEGNAGKLQQVFMNLLTNARDAFSQEQRDKKITIESSASGGRLLLAFSDNGRGIDRATLPNIFDPFFTTKPVGQGTGLGLSISHGIITSFKGTISVESRVGAGTTFTIALPVVEGVPESPRRAGTVVKKAFLGKVLVVDDEGAIRAILRNFLERLGLTVLEADDGDTAWETLQREPNIEYLLADFRMKRMNGDVLIRKVRERSDLAGIKIVMVTGGSSEEGGAIQANAFLEKPFDLTEVQRVIEAVTNSDRDTKRSC